MSTFPWRHVLPGALAAFFLLGGTLNIFASPEIRADYDRWGYPGWFPYLTAALEWTAAVLIAIPRTRLAGHVLGAGVMGAAALTVLLHGEFSYAIPPLVVLALLGLSGGWLLRQGNVARP